ncbi:MAG TPA: patatin-like phospholipase family protein [Bryobacteraceae bacterium]|jgi:hypothetical protein
MPDLDKSNPLADLVRTIEAAPDMAESERMVRQILRLHKEQGFSSEDDEDRQYMELRDRIDQELDRIMGYELRVQTGSPVDETVFDTTSFGYLLRNSPSFIQYLNYYLYFGVRFAAGRVAQSCHPLTSDRACGPDTLADCNETVAALPSPPLCPEAVRSPGAVERFLHEELRTDVMDPLLRKALRFLDDFVDKPQKSALDPRRPAKAEPYADDRHTRYQLWLHGLISDPSPGDTTTGDTPEESFWDLTAGLIRWARNRYEFYSDLEAVGEKQIHVSRWKSSPWVEGRWHASNPIAARCAIVDFYWLARLLRADVSARGLVTYADHSWLYLIGTKHPPLNESKAEERRFLAAAEVPDPQEILRWQEVLRSVFGYACDLIQNAVEIAEDCQDQTAAPADYPRLPPGNKCWRAVYDEELSELREQRREWRPNAGFSGSDLAGKCDDKDYATPGDAVPPPGTCNPPNAPYQPRSVWSRRVWTGEDVENLVGIALSGGGIRSATFNLGVLQALQELDLLRRVDYLSTVSGGGYIGSWLVGNVRRTRYWLSRMTSWDRSIDHLRRYSDYLAPHNGVLSADTWTMWGTWIRNAFLIQLTGFAWVAALLTFIMVCQPLFLWLGKDAGLGVSGTILILLMLIIASIVAFYQWQLAPLTRTPKPNQRRILWMISEGAVLPKIAAGLAWVATFLTAARLWGETANLGMTDAQCYSCILKNGLTSWRSVMVPFIVFVAALAYFNAAATGVRRILLSAATAIVTALTSYFAYAGLLRLFGAFYWNNAIQVGERADWLAYVTGPPIAMLSVTLGIVLFIGVLGRNAADWSREWWTRYGAWIAMIGGTLLLLSAAAVFAPLWVYRFWELLSGPTFKAGAVIAWIGSIVSGLLAGKSSRTGDAAKTSSVLEWVAFLGGFAFIVGAVILAATTVNFVLGEALVDSFSLDPVLYWQNLSAITVKPFAALPGAYELPVICVAVLTIAALFSWRFDLNIFGLNQFYRNRLVRCYLGATRWQPGKRHPHLFTAFDMADDIYLTNLRSTEPHEPEHRHTRKQFCQERYRGPLPIVNCTLNLGGSSDLTVHTRQSSSFSLTPLYCGTQRPKVGYAPTPAYAGGITLGQAMSVSGAAASPNMGYNTSPLVSLLLTLFNVRLGWWFPNPGKASWHRVGPLGARQLMLELFGLADENRDFINVSDGGHFENLGIYELVRRRARVIIASDAECDPLLTFGSLGNVVRICETDFGAKIDIDLSSIRKDEKTGFSRSHCAIGKITYSNGTLGYLIYIKASLTSDEDVGIMQYRSGHPTFPHETTADQFFREDQFEAYRRLGYEIAKRTFRDATDILDMYGLAAKLFDLWVPAGCDREAFLANSRAFDQLWDRFRSDPNLSSLLKELTGELPAYPTSPSPAQEVAELCACMELLQLMENAFLDLRLDDFWEHPDNRGWAMFFHMCARSPKFRAVWNKVRSTYGIRFEYFCNQHLGLEKADPVVRV